MEEYLHENTYPWGPPKYVVLNKSPHNDLTQNQEQ